ncbi:hypothetical protein DEO48_25230 [Enterobacter sp. CGMCC 5087]|uniref:hypothetical protein n=1 Tax=Enterobacter sp. CGMCC 5087 TaxID=2183878 RepID=UPI000D67438F|nr:hypothetical protein [Enterobacter sp. CGMCC 5087]PWI77269.1 hypothetical protein DEO48_25230 [Enterobacter sp. CGMCC 5087]
MPTFAELMDRDDTTPEQLREALRRQRERQENTWRKKRQEKLSYSEKPPDADATKLISGRKKKKESSGEQLNIRLNNAQQEVLGKLTDKLGISKSGVMKVALMALNQQYK